MLSCAKEKSDTSAPTVKQTDEQLVNQIKWFMNSAKDVEEGKILKSGEKMSIDSAINCISNTLNYVYCFGDATFRQIKTDTVLIKIPILSNENRTYIVDALDGYNLSVDKIRQKYMRISGTNKHLLCCVVQNAGANSSNDSVIMRVIAQVGTGVNSNTSSNYTDEEQYWWYNSSWNCYDGSGSEGAPEILQQGLNSAFLPAPPANCIRVFSNTGIIYFLNPKSYAGDGVIDNFCDYKMYYASDAVSTLTDEVKCLGIELDHPNVHEMDFYFNGMSSIISNWLNANNNNFRVCEVNSTTGSEPNPYANTIYHTMKLTYGHAYIVCDWVPMPIATE